MCRQIGGISLIFGKCPDRLIISITAKPYMLQKTLFHVPATTVQQHKCNKCCCQKDILNSRTGPKVLISSILIPYKMIQIIHTRNQALRAWFQNSRCLFTENLLYLSYLRSQLKSDFSSNFQSCIYKSAVCLIQQQQLYRVLYSDLGGCCKFLT